MLHSKRRTILVCFTFDHSNDRARVEGRQFPNFSQGRKRDLPGAFLVYLGELQCPFLSAIFSDESLCSKIKLNVDSQLGLIIQIESQFLPNYGVYPFVRRNHLCHILIKFLKYSKNAEYEYAETKTYEVGIPHFPIKFHI